MELKFMQQQPLLPRLTNCPNCQQNDRTGVHSHQERRFICHRCGQTFAETKGTPLYGLHYPIWVVVQVLTLLAHACPVNAIVAAFFIDERTIYDWLKRAGQHGEHIQQKVVCNGQVDLGQVQADELYVKCQGGRVWMATAMTVFSRLFLWGEVATQRSQTLIQQLMNNVKTAAINTTNHVLFAVDGFAAYPKVILKTFYSRIQTGKRGRPRHLRWPNLHIVQVIKTHKGRKLDKIKRCLAYGCSGKAYELIAQTQMEMGLFNTSFIERLNATFRARIPSLVRRTRNLAKTSHRIKYEMFWSGAVYNFCSKHASLNTAPAVAAGLIDEMWSVEKLLRFKTEIPPLHDKL